MEERILRIVTAMAQGAVTRDNQGAYYCTHCRGEWTEGEDEDDHGYISHASDCPVVAARDVMHENGLRWLS